MPIEEPAEKIQAFCELLRTSNPVLESGAADLGRLAHDLGDTESRLSLDIAALATELDALQKEVEASGLAIEKACSDLGQAAEQAKTSVLGDLEKAAATLEGQWSPQLKEKAMGLESVFQEMKSSGWEPLTSALAHEHAEFEKWTQVVDEVLPGLAHLFSTLAGDVEHAARDATEAGHDLSGPPLMDHAYWNDPESEAEKVTHETIPRFRGEEPDASRELAGLRDQLVSAVGEDGNHVRGQVDLTTRQLAAAVDAQASELNQALGRTKEALARLQLEFERSTVQADEAKPDVQSLSDLANKVPEAEAMLQRIRAATEAMAE
ncbi:MAG TPA: hypothetical protein VN461_14375 [Vicinamibacteria bacterium]|jgi:hypothetical protein|nr:hypothetical protein [Vicinamibacteria bacterium]